MKQRDIKLVLADAMGSAVALYFAFLLRFEFVIPADFKFILIEGLPVFAVIQMLTFSVSGIYSRMWRYTSLFDLYAIVSSVVTSSGLSLLCSFKWGLQDIRINLLLYFIFNSIIIVGIRLSVQFTTAIIIRILF